MIWKIISWSIFFCRIAQPYLSVWLFYADYSELFQALSNMDPGLIISLTKQIIWHFLMAPCLMIIDLQPSWNEKVTHDSSICVSEHLALKYYVYPAWTLSLCCAAWLGVSGRPGHVRSTTEPATASSTPWLGGAAGQPGEDLLCQSWEQNHTMATTHNAVRMILPKQELISLFLLINCV